MNARHLCLLALLPLAGCVAMPQYVPLDPAVQTSLRDIRAVSAIYQDEIFLAAASPGVAQAAGGGLLAALAESQIAKGRQSEIQAIIEPFYASIDDVDFRKTFWAAVVPELRKQYAGKALDLKTTAAVINMAERSKLVAALAAGKAFLYMATRYSFTPDFSRLEVVTSIDLWRGGQAEPVYSNVFNYQSVGIGATGSGAIALWGRENAHRYRALLDEGVAETVRMLRLDAQFPRPKGAEQRKVLEQQSSRMVVRNPDGRLHSLPR